MTYTPDLVEGMLLETPVKGSFQKSYPVTWYPNGDVHEYLVTVLTLEGSRAYLASDTETWTLTPEHTLVWQPDELSALRDGDSLVFIGAEVDNEEQARAWAARHYPDARFQIDDD